jgi:hypothetical protein
MARSTRTPKARKYHLNIEIHPELRKGLRVASARAGEDMKDWFHHFLCCNFGRMDLYHHVPGAMSENLGSD